MKIKTTFRSKGLVLGNYWGGGSGAYKAKTLIANTMKEIVEQATEMVANNSLDSGMGFESLSGALLEIDTISTTEIDGKKFINIETEEVLIGNLTEEQQDFLFNSIEYI